MRDNLDAMFKEAKEKKVKNDEKREKEAKKAAKREEKRKKMEFDAINSMKMANGGSYAAGALDLDPIGYDAESGMKVYRVDQLNIGKGGNTPLCPFDCDCCFFSVCWIMRLWEGKRPAVLLRQGSLFVNSLIPLTECQQFGELSPFHFSVSALLVSE